MKITCPASFAVATCAFAILSVWSDASLAAEPLALNNGQMYLMLDPRLHGVGDACTLTVHARPALSCGANAAWRHHTGAIRDRCCESVSPAEWAARLGPCPMAETRRGVGSDVSGSSDRNRRLTVRANRFGGKRPSCRLSIETPLPAS